MLKTIRDQVSKSGEQDLNAQMSLAVGAALRFRVDKDEKRPKPDWSTHLAPGGDS